MMLISFPYLRLVSRLSHRLEKPQGAEGGALISAQLGTQSIHQSWLEGRAAMSSNISAAISAQGAPARTERCWGTWTVDSIIIKENLFHLWV